MDVDLDLSDLTEEEKATIKQVLLRDSMLRIRDERRVIQLKAELQRLRKRGMLRQGLDPSRSCACCMMELGRIINRGAVCPLCRKRICKACRHDGEDGQRWVCLVCHKQMELKAASGEWMRDFCRSSGRRRGIRTADLISKSFSQTLRSKVANPADTMLPHSDSNEPKESPQTSAPSMNTWRSSPVYSSTPQRGTASGSDSCLAQSSKSNSHSPAPRGQMINDLQRASSLPQSAGGSPDGAGGGVSNSSPVGLRTVVRKISKHVDSSSSTPSSPETGKSHCGSNRGSSSEDERNFRRGYHQPVFKRTSAQSAVVMTSFKSSETLPVPSGKRGMSTSRDLTIAGPKLAAWSRSTSDDVVDRLSRSSPLSSSPNSALSNITPSKASMTLRKQRSVQDCAVTSPASSYSIDGPTHFISPSCNNNSLIIPGNTMIGASHSAPDSGAADLNYATPPVMFFSNVDLQATSNNALVVDRYADRRRFCEEGRQHSGDVDDGDKGEEEDSRHSHHSPGSLFHKMNLKRRKQSLSKQPSDSGDKTHASPAELDISRTNNPTSLVSRTAHTNNSSHSFVSALRGCKKKTRLPPSLFGHRPLLSLFRAAHPQVSDKGSTGGGEDRAIAPNVSDRLTNVVDRSNNPTQHVGAVHSHVSLSSLSSPVSTTFTTNDNDQQDVQESGDVPGPTGRGGGISGIKMEQLQSQEEEFAASTSDSRLTPEDRLYERRLSSVSSTPSGSPALQRIRRRGETARKLQFRFRRRRNSADSDSTVPENALSALEGSPRRIATFRARSASLPSRRFIEDVAFDSSALDWRPSSVESKIWQMQEDLPPLLMPPPPPATPQLRGDGDSHSEVNFNIEKWVPEGDDYRLVFISSSDVDDDLTDSVEESSLDEPCYYSTRRRGGAILRVRSRVEVSGGTMYIEDSDWEFCSDSDHMLRVSSSQSLDELSSSDLCVTTEDTSSSKSSSLKTRRSLSMELLPSQCELSMFSFEDHEAMETYKPSLTDVVPPPKCFDGPEAADYVTRAVETLKGLPIIRSPSNFGSLKQTKLSSGVSNQGSSICVSDKAVPSETREMYAVTESRDKDLLREEKGDDIVVPHVIMTDNNNAPDAVVDHTLLSESTRRATIPANGENDNGDVMPSPDCTEGVSSAPGRGERDDEEIENGRGKRKENRDENAGDIGVSGSRDVAGYFGPQVAAEISGKPTTITTISASEDARRTSPVAVLEIESAGQSRNNVADAEDTSVFRFLPLSSQMSVCCPTIGVSSRGCSCHPTAATSPSQQFGSVELFVQAATEQEESQVVVSAAATLHGIREGKENTGAHALCRSPPVEVIDPDLLGASVCEGGGARKTELENRLNCACIANDVAVPDGAVANPNHGGGDGNADSSLISHVVSDGERKSADARELIGLDEKDANLKAAFSVRNATATSDHRELRDHTCAGVLLVSDAAASYFSTSSPLHSPCNESRQVNAKACHDDRGAWVDTTEFISTGNGPSVKNAMAETLAGEEDLHLSENTSAVVAVIPVPSGESSRNAQAEIYYYDHTLTTDSDAQLAEAMSTEMSPDTNGEQVKASAQDSVEVSNKKNRHSPRNVSENNENERDPTESTNTSDNCDAHKNKTELAASGSSSESIPTLQTENETFQEATEEVDHLESDTDSQDTVIEGELCEQMLKIAIRKKILMANEELSRDDAFNVPMNISGDVPVLVDSGDNGDHSHKCEVISHDKSMNIMRTEGTESPIMFNNGMINPCDAIDDYIIHSMQEENIEKSAFDDSIEDSDRDFDDNADLQTMYAGAKPEEEEGSLSDSSSSSEEGLYASPSIIYRRPNYIPSMLYSLHTIMEESCEESEHESWSGTPTNKAPPSELEKYFSFAIGNSDVNKRSSIAVSEDENSTDFSDNASETSGSMCEENGDNGLCEADPADLAASRLEKYFTSGLLGTGEFKYPDDAEFTEDGSAISDAEETSIDNKLAETDKSNMCPISSHPDRDKRTGDKSNPEHPVGSSSGTSEIPESRINLEETRDKVKPDVVTMTREKPTVEYDDTGQLVFDTDGFSTVKRKVKGMHDPTDVDASLDLHSVECTEPQSSLDGGASDEGCGSQVGDGFKLMDDVHENRLRMDSDSGFEDRSMDSFKDMAASLGSSDSAFHSLLSESVDQNSKSSLVYRYACINNMENTPTDVAAITTTVQKNKTNMDTKNHIPDFVKGLAVPCNSQVSLEIPNSYPTRESISEKVDTGAENSLQSTISEVKSSTEEAKDLSPAIPAENKSESKVSEGFSDDEASYIMNRLVAHISVMNTTDSGVQPKTEASTADCVPPWRALESQIARLMQTVSPMTLSADERSSSSCSSTIGSNNSDYGSDTLESAEYSTTDEEDITNNQHEQSSLKEFKLTSPARCPSRRGSAGGGSLGSGDSSDSTISEETMYICKQLMGSLKKLTNIAFPDPSGSQDFKSADDVTRARQYIRDQIVALMHTVSASRQSSPLREKRRRSVKLHSDSSGAASNSDSQESSDQDSPKLPCGKNGLKKIKTPSESGSETTISASISIPSYDDSDRTPTESEISHEMDELFALLEGSNSILPESVPPKQAGMEADIIPDVDRLSLRSWDMPIYLLSKVLHSGDEDGKTSLSDLQDSLKALANSTAAAQADFASQPHSNGESHEYTLKEQNGCNLELAANNQNSGGLQGVQQIDSTVPPLPPISLPSSSHISIMSIVNSSSATSSTSLPTGMHPDVVAIANTENTVYISGATEPLMAVAPEVCTSAFQDEVTDFSLCSLSSKSQDISLSMDSLKTSMDSIITVITRVHGNCDDKNGGTENRSGQKGNISDTNEGKGRSDQQGAEGGESIEGGDESLPKTLNTKEKASSENNLLVAKSLAKKGSKVSATKSAGNIAELDGTSTKSVCRDTGYYSFKSSEESLRSLDESASRASSVSQLHRKSLTSSETIPEVEEEVHPKPRRLFTPASAAKVSLSSSNIPDEVFTSCSGSKSSTLPSSLRGRILLQPSSTRVRPFTSSFFSTSGVLRKLAALRDESGFSHKSSPRGRLRGRIRTPSGSSDDARYMGSVPQIAVSDFTDNAHGSLAGSDRESSLTADDDMDSVFQSRGHMQSQISLSSFGARSESMSSVYSAAGRFGTVTVTGEVLFSIGYICKTSTFEVHVKKCQNLAPIDTKRNRSDPYVKVYLLPDRTKSGKRKTKVKKHTVDPVFEELLKFNITLSELETRTFWLSVWHSDIFGRNVFLGEVMFPLSSEMLENTSPKWYPLQERTEAIDSTLSYKGDLQISLKFVPPDITSQKRSKRPGMVSKGSLHVLVKEACNLMATRSNGTSDPFCKSYLLPDKSKSSKQKTSVIKKTCNPKWNHTFVYEDVTIDDLHERCLELTIWDYDKITSNEFLGGARLSCGTGKWNGKDVDWMDSQGKESDMWEEMLAKPNTWVEGTLKLRPSM